MHSNGILGCCCFFIGRVRSGIRCLSQLRELARNAMHEMWDSACVANSEVHWPTKCWKVKVAADKLIGNCSAAAAAQAGNKYSIKLRCSCLLAARI